MRSEIYLKTVVFCIVTIFFCSTSTISFGAELGSWSFDGIQTLSFDTIPDLIVGGIPGAPYTLTPLPTSNTFTITNADGSILTGTLFSGMLIPVGMSAIAVVAASNGTLYLSLSQTDIYFDFMLDNGLKGTGDLSEAFASARIDSYSPTSTVQVQVGTATELSVTITNTGMIPSSFTAGATVWDSVENQVANYSTTLVSPLQPGEQTTVSWNHTVNQEGNYWLQFSIWTNNNLVDQEPNSPKQLITGIQDTTWATSISGSWDIASNWNPQVVPTSRSDTTIAPGGAVTVIGPAAPAAVKSLTIGASTGGLASLQLQSSGNLTVVNALKINATGSLTTTGANVSAASVTNDGLITFSSTITVTPNSGTFTQNANGTFNVQINGDSQYGQLVVGTTTLDGNLKVTLGPAYLPEPNLSYNVVASLAPVTGTFPSNHTVIEAKYPAKYDPYGNNGSAGLFNADYNNGVKLSNFHQVHVLSFGVLDTIAGQQLNGFATANAVHNAFAKLPGIVDNVVDATHTIPASTSTNAAEDLKEDVNYIADMVQSGDTFVFYINTHSTYGDNPLSKSEPPVLRNIPNPNNKDDKNYYKPFHNLSYYLF